MTELEVIQEEEDISKSEEDEETIEETQHREFQVRWQNSKFYKYVHKIIADELYVNEVEAQMEARYANGETMGNDEIGEATRAEFMSKIRLKRVKEILT